jgi:universal stress protein A
MKEQACMLPWWPMGMRNFLAGLLCAWAGTGDVEPRRPAFRPGFAWKSMEASDNCDGAQLPTPAWSNSLNFLVPVDFTVSSLLALNWAFKLARKQKAHVSVLHAIPINLFLYGPANPSLIMEDMRNSALARISKMLEAAKQAGVSFSYDIEEGRPSVVIENYIRRHDIDLVFLAPHKQHGLNRFLRCKTAETLIRRAGCPVLILNH